MRPRIEKRGIILAGLALVFFVSLGYFAVLRGGNIRTPLKNYFAHSWRSVKKLPNIVYLPYWFAKSDLPQYHVFIDIKEIEELNNNVPVDLDEMDYGFLSDDNKSYVNAYFAGDDGYRSKIKIRYRGLMQNHWQAEQKSFKIRFPDDNLFQGMRELNLIIPLDRSYFVSVFNSYRAKNLGVVAPDIKFVRLNINKRDSGVYLASEAWSKEFLAKNGIADVNNILSNKDTAEAMLPDEDKPPFTDWKSYTADAENENGPFEELDALRELVSKAPDDVFYKYINKLVDLEKIYKWQLVTVLSGSAHQSDSSNLVLLFRRETGKFEPVVWDIELEELKDEIYAANQPLLIRRIFKSKTYSDKFVEILKNYVENEENLKKDLDYYDQIVRSMKKEFYSDQAKNENNFAFNGTNNKNRELIVKNFHKAKELLVSGSINRPEVASSNYSKSPSFAGSFKYLLDTEKSINQFISENPQFKKVNEKTLGLGAGSHVFYKTVIIPSDLKLVIEPGAKLLFNPGISLVSYSQVEARGDASSPIVMTSAYPNSDKPWGVFAVVNTRSAKNYFKNLIVSGGSQDLINGIDLLSQFSLHDAQSIVENSTFRNGKSDDGFHAILGSVSIRNSIFEDNSSDGVDLDNIEDSVVFRNTFFNADVNKSGTDGDGLDISTTKNLEVSDNKIYNFGDKCISVGEGAEAILRNNIMANCSYGLAVKDNSRVRVDRSIIVGNRTGGLTLYRKKQEFISGGDVIMENSILWNNSKEILIDETTYYPTKSGEWKKILNSGTSSLSIRNSTVMNGYDGESISTEKPDLKKILPANIYSSIFTN